MAQGLADTEIVDQLVTFFLAATETTASALAWALHLLKQNAVPSAEEHDEQYKSVLSHA